MVKFVKVTEKYAKNPTYVNVSHIVTIRTEFNDRSILTYYTGKTACSIDIDESVDSVVRFINGDYGD